MGIGLGLLAMILRLVGGFVVFGFIIGGIYTLFATSVGLGLMMIGGAVVGGWALNIVAGLMMVAGNAVLEREAAKAHSSHDDDI